MTSDHDSDNTSVATPVVAAGRLRWSSRHWLILLGSLALISVAIYRGRQFMASLEEQRQQRVVEQQLSPYGGAAQIWQGHVVQVTFVGGEFQSSALSALKEFPQLRKLVFVDTPLSDDGLAALPTLPQLRELVVIHAPLTDQCLPHVAKVHALEYLQLTETQITGKELAQLNQLTQLRRLDLQQSQLTDENLEQLSGLRQLAALYLSGRDLTAAGVQQLKLALPTTTVIFSEE